MLATAVQLEKTLGVFLSDRGSCLPGGRVSGCTRGSRSDLRQSRRGVRLAQLNGEVEPRSGYIHESSQS